MTDNTARSALLEAAAIARELLPRRWGSMVEAMRDRLHGHDDSPAASRRWVRPASRWHKALAP